MFIALLLSILFCPMQAGAWPLDAEWIVLTKSTTGLTDVVSDSQGGANDPRDIVTSSSAYPAAYIFNDGTFMYFRIRVDLLEMLGNRISRSLPYLIMQQSEILYLLAKAFPPFFYKKKPSVSVSYNNFKTQNLGLKNFF